MVLDLIVILVIALFTFIGYKQGLVKTAIKILAFFIALVVSLMLYKTIGNVIMKNTQVDEQIQNTIVSKVLPEDYEEKLEILPDALVESGETTVNELSKNLTEKIIYGVVFIVLFVVLKIALKFVTLLTDLITKLPVIKQFDKTGGIVYGVAKGFIIVTVIFAVISLISPMLDAKYINAINNSYLSAMLYNHNLLIGLIK